LLNVRSTKPGFSKLFTLVENELFPSWPDGVVYPTDESKAQFFGHGHLNIKIGDWRPGFLNAGAPLVFVSIFKLLDMLVEWILEENGLQSPFQFQKKLQLLNDSPVFGGVTAQLSRDRRCRPAEPASNLLHGGALYAKKRNLLPLCQ
jgi:hypothetical protein